MKLVDGVIVVQNGDEHVLVASGDASKSFSGIIKLNSTAAYIVDLLIKGTTKEKAIESLTSTYNVDAQNAAKSFDGVVDSIRPTGLILE